MRDGSRVPARHAVRPGRRRRQRDPAPCAAPVRFRLRVALPGAHARSARGDRAMVATGEARRGALRDRPRRGPLRAGLLAQPLQPRPQVDLHDRQARELVAGVGEPARTREVAPRWRSPRHPPFRHRLRPAAADERAGGGNRVVAARARGGPSRPTACCACSGSTRRSSSAASSAPSTRRPSRKCWRRSSASCASVPFRRAASTRPCRDRPRRASSPSSASTGGRRRRSASPARGATAWCR